MTSPSTPCRRRYARARAATRGSRARADEAILGDLPWLDILTRRDARGAVTDPELLSRGHHFGCLFAHIAQWQMAADTAERGHHGVRERRVRGRAPGRPRERMLGAVQANAPADYDVVFLHHPGEGPQVGDKVSAFTSERGDEVEMFTYEHPDGPSAGCRGTCSVTASCARCCR